jgi:chromosome segregation ATPase
VTNYSPSGVKEADVDAVEQLEVAFREDSVTWIDIQGFGDKSLMQNIGDLFELHPLLLEDVVNVPQRPKTEAYGGQLLMIVRMVRVGRPGEIDMEQVSIVFAKTYVLMFQERLTELAKQIAATNQRLDESKKQTATVTPDAEPTGEAKRFEQDARQRALEGQLLLLQTESRRYEALAELFPLQRDFAMRVVAFREKEAAAWQQLVGCRRKEESQRQGREARQQVENAHPALRSLAERNAVLAERRQKLTGGIDRVSKERKSLNQETAQLKDDYDKITEKVARARHSTSVGLMLRKLRDDLPERQRCADRLRFIQREMPNVHLRLMELEEERGQLGDVESLAGLDPARRADALALAHAARPAADIRDRVLLVF